MLLKERFVDSPKISFEDKNNKERKIIEELLASVKEKPKDQVKYVRFLNYRLHKLFKLELDYMGLDYFDKDHPDGFKFKCNSHKKRAFAGGYLGKLACNEQHEVYLSKAEVLLTYESLMKYIFNDNSTMRIIGMRFLLVDLFHEIAHLKQSHKLYDSRVSLTTMRYAKEHVYSEESKNNYEFYNINHDNFFSEADAELDASTVIEETGTNDVINHDNTIIPRANREVSLFLMPGLGIVDRDLFINTYVDTRIIKNQALFPLMRYPILGKEYGSFFRKLVLSELINNYHKELSEIDKSVEDNDKKIPLIKDVTGYYLDAITRKIVDSDVLEIYDAIKSCGEDDVKKLFNLLIIHNRAKYTRKKVLWENKIEVKRLTDSIEKHMDYNNGYIADPNKKYKDIICTSDYIKSLKYEENPNIRKEVIDFINSDLFRERIPIHGYFLTKKHKKVTIKDFIDNYVIPEIDERVKSEIPFNQKYLEAWYLIELKDKFAMSCEMDQIVINKNIMLDYKERDQALNRAINIANNISNLDIDYDLYESIRKVFLICKGSTKYLDGLNYEMVEIMDRLYFCYDPYVKEILDNLLNAAQYLTYNKTLNPNGINYYKKFRNNRKVKEILGFIKEYDAAKAKFDKQISALERKYPKNGGKND